ncbi:MAG: DUF3822 family protein [Chitinophagaceae bacterium]
MPKEATYTIEEKTSILHTERETCCTILLGKTYLTYVYTSVTLDKVYLVKHFDIRKTALGKTDFDEILYDLFIKKSKSYRIGIDTYKNLLLPTIIDSKDCLKLFESMYETFIDETIQYDIIDNEKKIYYAIDTQIKKLLTSSTIDIKCFNSGTALLKTYPSVLNSNKKVVAFVSIKDEIGMLSVYEDKNLLLHQTYPFLTPTDILYQLLSIKKNKINDQEMMVYLHGENNSVTQTYDLLKNYFKQVSYLPRIQNIEYPEDIEKVPAHFFYNVFSLATCEL